MYTILVLFAWRWSWVELLRRNWRDHCLVVWGIVCFNELLLSYGRNSSGRTGAVGSLEVYLPRVGRLGGHGHVRSSTGYRNLLST